MRRTKSCRQAIERTRAAFPSAVRPEIPKKPVRELAFMFDSLRRQKVPAADVQVKVRWYGLIPARGVSGWEQEALEWGRIDFHEEA